MLSLIKTLAVLLFSSTLINHTPAQVIGNAPVPVNGAAFVRSRTKLYVQGGTLSVNGNTVAQQTQMFALDLAVPWNAVSPVWISYKQGPTQGFHTAAISVDEQTVVTFRASTSSSSSTTLSYRYHVGNNAWDQSSVRVQNPSKEGISAVQDPISGLVYLAGGYQSDDSQMYVYNIDTDSISMFSMPSNYLVDRAYYSGVYLRIRKSIVYFGGASSSGSPSMDLMTEFVPSTGAWSTLVANNQNPPHRTDFCMAANDAGTKIVVFGGRLDNGGLARDLWVLDVPSLTWTQGQSWSEPRISATCTIAGSTFISWGGSNGQRTVDGTAVLYDLNQGLFISSYVPPVEYVNGNGIGNGFGAGSNDGTDNNRRQGSQRNPYYNSGYYPDGSDIDGPDEKMKSSTLIIAGGIIGSVFLIACLALLSVFVRRRRQKIQGQCISFNNGTKGSCDTPGRISSTLQPRPSNSFPSSFPRMQPRPMEEV